MLLVYRELSTSSLVEPSSRWTKYGLLYAPLQSRDETKAQRAGIPRGGWHAHSAWYSPQKQGSVSITDHAAIRPLCVKNAKRHGIKLYGVVRTEYQH